MPAAHEEAPLEVLSAHQRAVVESHIRLVHFTIHRNRHLVRRRQSGRDQQELFQEGCLALIDAVRNHDAALHGHFGPYAMSRIHFALSRYVHENEGIVRVPFITQRRRRANGIHQTADSRTGMPLPTVQRLGDAATPPSRHASDQEVAGQHRLGDLIADRIDIASRKVVDEMKRAPRCAPGTAEVIERCAQERWRIPEPDARTSIRKLAKALDCSIGRITHCEERYRQRMGKALNNDPTYCRLRAEARASERGFDERLSPDRLDKLRPDRPAADLTDACESRRTSTRRPRARKQRDSKNPAATKRKQHAPKVRAV